MTRISHRKGGKKGSGGSEGHIPDEIRQQMKLTGKQGYSSLEKELKPGRPTGRPNRFNPKTPKK